MPKSHSLSEATKDAIWELRALGPMRLSHETIYRGLYVQTRGSLKRELTAHLRRGRQRRFARSQSSKGQGQGQGQGQGKIAEMVMISERPPEVEDRAVPGHWEDDLVMGNRQSPAAIATLVERQTRYCQLIALPEGPSAEAVADALAASIATLPAQLRRVKKIAKKQANKGISKRAPGLSVANAVNATNATRADSAGSADSVGGLSLKRVFFKAAPNTPVAEIASLGVLRINAGCDVAGNVVATVEPASGAPPLELKHEGEGNVNPVFDDLSSVTTPRSITFGGSSAAGMVRVASTNGAVVTLDYGYDNAPTFGGENVCTLSGILIG